MFETGLKVVSSHLTTHAYMLGLRVTGNLAMLAIVTPAKAHDSVAIHLLNLAKMETIDGWLEKNRPMSPEDAVRILRPAIVRSFHKIDKTRWAVAA